MSKNNRVSRRQFLSYTLTGVGGFMAAGMLAPMVRFAIDPVLQPADEGEFVAVAKEDEITNEPKRFDFKVKQVDAWYESEVPLSAWVYRQENGEILPMSPICKHLGCTVNWGVEGYENQFYCPCHDGLYTKEGINVPGTPPPAPLDVYDHKIEDGTLYLGKAKPRGGA
jgi:menaquinol-cytochrome c reductase iron-sulfur subunit